MSSTTITELEIDARDLQEGDLITAFVISYRRGEPSQWRRGAFAPVSDIRRSEDGRVWGCEPFGQCPGYWVRVVRKTEQPRVVEPAAHVVCQVRDVERDRMVAPFGTLKDAESQAREWLAEKGTAGLRWTVATARADCCWVIARRIDLKNVSARPGSASSRLFVSQAIHFKPEALTAGFVCENDAREGLKTCEKNPSYFDDVFSKGPAGTKPPNTWQLGYERDLKPIDFVWITGDKVEVGDELHGYRWLDDRDAQKHHAMGHGGWTTVRSIVCEDGETVTTDGKLYIVRKPELEWMVRKAKRPIVAEPVVLPGVSPRFVDDLPRMPTSEESARAVDVGNASSIHDEGKEFRLTAHDREAWSVVLRRKIAESEAERKRRDRNRVLVQREFENHE